VCNNQYNFAELDLRTGKRLSCKRLKTKYVAVTGDSRFLLTAAINRNNEFRIEKHSIRTKKLIGTLEGHADVVYSMSISHDNKLLFIVYFCTIYIVDIENFKVIKTFKTLDFGMVTSISCRRDNSGAYFSVTNGNIKLITWKPNSSKVEDFDCSRSFKSVFQNHDNTTTSIILINDDNQLLVGSKNMFYLLSAKTLNTIKVFRVDGDFVVYFGLIEKDTKVLVVDISNFLYIYDCKKTK